MLIEHPAEENQVFLFSRILEQYEPMTCRNILSVPGPTTNLSIKNRAIVQYIGDDAGKGTWKCSKDSGFATCAHVDEAEKRLSETKRAREGAKLVRAHDDTTVL